MLGWRMLHKMFNSAKNFSWDSLGLLQISTLNLFAAYNAPSILTCSTLPYAPAPSCLPVGSAFLTSDFNLSESSSHFWAVKEIDYGHITIASQTTFGNSKCMLLWWWLTIPHLRCVYVFVKCMNCHNSEQEQWCRKMFWLRGAIQKKGGRDQAQSARRSWG